MKVLYYVLCSAMAFGVWYLCDFLIYGVSRDFGNGVAAGGALVLGFMFVADRIEQARKRQEIIEPEEAGYVEVLPPEGEDWWPQSPHLLPRGPVRSLRSRDGALPRR